MLALNGKYELAIDQWISANADYDQYDSTKSQNATIYKKRLTGLILLASQKLFDSLSFNVYKTISIHKLDDLSVLLFQVAGMDESIRYNLIRFYDQSAWYAIFANDYQKGSEFARQGLPLDSGNVSLQIRLLLTLMLDNQADLGFKIFNKLQKSDQEDKIQLHRTLFNQINIIKQHGVTNNNLESLIAKLM